jgi:hypothetical protein
MRPACLALMVAVPLLMALPKATATPQGSPPQTTQTPPPAKPVDPTPPAPAPPTPTCYVLKAIYVPGEPLRWARILVGDKWMAGCVGPAGLCFAPLLGSLLSSICGPPRAL